MTLSEMVNAVFSNKRTLPEPPAVVNIDPDVLVVEQHTVTIFRAGVRFDEEYVVWERYYTTAEAAKAAAEARCAWFDQHGGGTTYTWYAEALRTTD